MLPGDMAETHTVIRNGLAALLSGVLVTATLAGAIGESGSDGRGTPPSRSVASTTWQPSLRAAEPAPGGQHAALALMRGERLSLRSMAADDLRLVDGIGPRRARELIAARRAGALESVADVDRLPGFGPRLVSRLAGAVAFAGDREDRR